MKINISIHHEMKSVEYKSIELLLEEVKHIQGISVNPKNETNGRLSRNIDFSILLEIIGGLQAISKLADIFLKYINSKNIEITIENKNGEKLIIKNSKSAVDVKNEIQDFLKRTEDKNSDKDKVKE